MRSSSSSPGPVPVHTRGPTAPAATAVSLAFPLLAASLLLLGPASLAAQDAEPDTRPGVAVLPFENGGSFGPDREDFEALQVGLQQMLLTELAQNSSLRVVERALLRALLEEQELALANRVQAGTAAEIGRLIGARYVITGAFMDVWGDFRMDARVIDVETGEILRTEQVRNRRERIYDMLVDLAGKVTEGADLPPLPIEARRERESREIPAEAVILFSRAQTYEDFGDRDRAIEAYQRIVSEFPEMTEARQALEQISGT
jgi:TolB-like protein